MEGDSSRSLSRPVFIHLFSGIYFCYSVTFVEDVADVAAIPVFRFVEVSTCFRLKSLFYCKISSSLFVNRLYYNPLIRLKEKKKNKGLKLVISVATWLAVTCIAYGPFFFLCAICLCNY